MHEKPIDYTRLLALEKEIAAMGAVVMVWTHDEVPDSVRQGLRQTFLDGCADEIETACARCASDVMEKHRTSAVDIDD